MNKSFLLIASLFISYGCKDQVSSDSKKITNQDTITACELTDSIAPIMDNALTLSDNGSTLKSAQIEWEAATDNCAFSHYELAIGFSVGAQDLLSFTNIGDVTNYQTQGLSFDYDKDYFFTLRAVDKVGNTSAHVTSSSWQIFNAKSLTNLVLWLDASELTSISDQEGDHPTGANFSNEISLWEDVSGSSAVHNFSTLTSRPNWDVIENAVRFSGSNQFLATADHTDINLSTIAQRTLITAIKTGNNITSRQVVYEEGGTVRGINIYVEDSKLRCGFWNDTNDGDGKQAYVEVEGTISQNTSYIVSHIFDYSNYNGAGGVNGSVSCYLNKNLLGNVDTTSRLFAHSGDIGLGAINEQSHFHDGPSSSRTDNFFNGIIYELLMYNSVHTETSRLKLINSMEKKWNIQN